MKKSNLFPFNPLNGAIEEKMENLANRGVLPNGRVGKPLKDACCLLRYKYQGAAPSGNQNTDGDLIRNTNQKFYLYCTTHEHVFETRWRYLFSTSETNSTLLCPYCAKESGAGRDFVTFTDLKALANRKDWDFEILQPEGIDVNQWLKSKDKVTLRCKKQCARSQEACNTQARHALSNILYTLRKDPEHILCQGACDSKKKGKARRLSKKDFENLLETDWSGSWVLAPNQHWEGVSSHYWFIHSACRQPLYLNAQSFINYDIQGEADSVHRKCPFCSRVSPCKSMFRESPELYGKYVQHITEGRIKFLSSHMPDGTEASCSFLCTACSSEFIASETSLRRNTFYGCPICSGNAASNSRAWRPEEMEALVLRRGFRPVDPPPNVTETVKFQSESGEEIQTSVLELCKTYPLYADGARRKAVAADTSDKNPTYANNGNQYTEDEVNWVKDNAGNMKYSEMATELGRSPGSVKQLFRRLGLRNDANPHYKRLTKLDDNAFDELTTAACYWAGLLAADGTLREPHYISLELAARDELLLGRFLKFLGSDGSLSYRTVSAVNGRNLYASLSFTSEIIYRKLQECFNLSPRKTISLQPPELESPELIRSFMLGFFDGDGHVRRRRDSALKVTIVCASREFLEWYAKQTEKILGKESVRIEEKTQGKRPYYQMTLHTSEAKRWLNALHESASEGMERKKNIAAG